MVKRIWTWFLAFAIAFSIAGCGEMRPPGQTRTVLHHTVRPGETLYSISWRYGRDYREVAAWNRIGPPYRIVPGQQLVVIPSYGTDAGPVAELPPQEVPPPSSKPVVRRKAAVSQVPAKPADNQISRHTSKPVRKDTIVWRWPTAGTLLHGFSPVEGRKGIDIRGHVGQPVYAAAGGYVVYSGDGLIGYGNLVIIKHDDVYLSAYGHNRRLLVKEGEQVEVGQRIAEMGQTGKDKSILHFEIRRGGKPVDPLRYLPKRESTLRGMGIHGYS